MVNPADTDLPIHAIIKDRWSPRAFSTDKLSRDDIFTLFEASRWAPSAYNDQPWYFIVAPREDKDAFDKLLGCLMPANQAWAKNAALLGVAIARTRFFHDGSPNRHALYDTGQGMALMTVQATAIGIRVHQMAGFSVESVRKSYSLPEGFEPITAFAAGYEGDPNSLPPRLQARETAPRTRRTLGETLFFGNWDGSKT